MELEPILDYIETKMPYTDIKPFIDERNYSHTDRAGTVYYKLRGVKDIEVGFNERRSFIILKASIMYFIQGHNLTFDKIKFVDAIDYIGKILKLDLWKLMTVEVLEFGIIMEVDKEPREYIEHIREGKGMLLYDDSKGKKKHTFRSYSDEYTSLKLYDAGLNAKKKLHHNIRKTLAENGFDLKGNYLKYEVHYSNPSHSLNDGKEIKLAALMSPQWWEKLKKDLYSQYLKLSPMQSISQPEKKSDYVVTDIITHFLAEHLINDGWRLDEIQDALINAIKQSPLLEKGDRQKRKQGIIAAFSKLSVDVVSEWDLKDKLHEALFGEVAENCCEDEEEIEENPEETTSHKEKPHEKIKGIGDIYAERYAKMIEDAYNERFAMSSNEGESLGIVSKTPRYYDDDDDNDVFGGYNFDRYMHPRLCGDEIGEGIFSNKSEEEKRKITNYLMYR